MFEHRKDVRVEVRVRNNLILKKMEERGIDSVAELCRRMEIPSQMTLVGTYVNMKEPARKEDGSWTKVAQALADFFNCLPDDLFSEPQQWRALEKNRSFAEIGFAEIQQITGNGEVDLEHQALAHEFKSTISNLLCTLKPLEERVLRMRFGLGLSEEMTLEAIGQTLGKNRERVRQIELSALRKLKHPSHSRLLLKAVGGEQSSRLGTTFDQKIIDALQ